MEARSERKEHRLTLLPSPFSSSSSTPWDPIGPPPTVGIALELAPTTCQEPVILGSTLCHCPSSSFFAPREHLHLVRRVSPRLPSRVINGLICSIASPSISPKNSHDSPLHLKCTLVSTILVPSNIRPNSLHHRHNRERESTSAERRRYCGMLPESRGTEIQRTNRSISR